MSETTPSHNFLLPTRKNLHKFKKQYLKKSRTPFTPDVILLEAPDGARFVMKDWSERPPLVRAVWSRFAAGREASTYKKIQGMTGVPQLIAQLDPYGFVIEWLDARPLPSRKFRDVLGKDFFETLDAILTEMHRRGVAHGDLRRRNILLGIDGKPRIIDFETALRGKNPFVRALAKVDRVTVLKIKHRYYPENTTPEELKILKDIPWHLRVGRFLRQTVYGAFSSKKRRSLERKRQAKKKG